MEWGWVALGLLAVWLLWANRKKQTAAKPAETTRLGMNMASDREMILATFRREIGNYLVRQDPDRFLRLKRKARSAEVAIEGDDKDTREAALTLITKKRPFYTDFDLVGTRDHVLYADGFSMYALEDIEDHYLDLVKFHALQRALDPDWQYRSAATSDEDVAHAEEYVRKLKDTKFRQRLLRAIQEFYRHRRQGEPMRAGGLEYESREFDVYRVQHIAEVRYGFHFKDTDEYGLYGFFYADARDKPYQHYYRSNRTFEEETTLDHLRIDEPV